MNNNGIFKFLKSYWQILIFIGGMIVAWTLVQNTTADNVERINKLEANQDGFSKDIQDIKISVKGIETSMGFLLEEYKKINKK